MSKEHLIAKTLPDMEVIKNTARYKFWEYMRDYHGLLLAESEIDDIVKMVEEIQKEDHIVEANEKVCPYCGSDIDVGSKNSKRCKNCNKGLVMSKMGKIEKIYFSESCTNCGDDLIVTTTCAESEDTEYEQFFYDGDAVRCAADCGFISTVSIDDDDGAYIADGNIDELEYQ